MSYGVTSGHIVSGIISSGARGGSGEIGHVVYDWNGPLCTCGNSGCLMQYASVPALLRDYQTATGAALSWDEFCSLATDDDQAATAVARRAACALGRVLVNTCHLIDPGAVILSGEVVRRLPAFIDETAVSMRAAALPLVARNVKILRAELTQVHAPTARAGIESLRRIDDVVASEIGRASCRERVF